MMAGCRFKVLMVLLLSMAVLMPTLRAGIAEYDDFLLKKAVAAEQVAHEAYNPDPMNVTNHLNLQVHLYVHPSYSSLTLFKYNSLFIIYSK